MALVRKKMMDAKKKMRYTPYDILIFLTIMFQGAKQLRIFPTPFYKYFIALLFVLLFLKYIREKRSFKISKAFAALLVVVISFSFIVTPTTKTIVPAIFFVIELLAFRMYLGIFDTRKAFFERLLSIILLSATALSIFGFIQIIGYNLHINFLYDFKWLGFVPNYYGYLGEGRFYSIYDEPAHLCTILGAGLFAGFYFFKKCKNIKYIFALLAIAVFALETGSVITYLSVIIFVIFSFLYNYHFLGQKISPKVILVLIMFFVTAASFAVAKPSLISNSMDKIDNFFSDNIDNVNSQNLTTFALKSNYLIAKKKINDGYIFGTGIFTHESYYYSYIDLVYEKHYQRYLNYTDAASIFIRLLSEFGILSMVIFLAIIAYIIRSYFKKDYIGTFLILLFITQSMRLGDYTWILTCLPVVAILSREKTGSTKAIGGKK